MAADKPMSVAERMKLLQQKGGGIPMPGGAQVGVTLAALKARARAKEPQTEEVVKSPAKSARIVRPSLANKKRRPAKPKFAPAPPPTRPPNTRKSLISVSSSNPSSSGASSAQQPSSSLSASSSAAPAQKRNFRSPSSIVAAVAGLAAPPRAAGASLKVPLPKGPPPSSPSNPSTGPNSARSSDHSPRQDVARALGAVISGHEAREDSASPLLNRRGSKKSKPARLLKVALSSSSLGPSPSSGRDSSRSPSLSVSPRPVSPAQRSVSSRAPPPIPSTHRKWQCSQCTLVNPPLALVCSACSNPKPMEATAGWKCHQCTVLNSLQNSKCTVCEAMKPISLGVEWPCKVCTFVNAVKPDDDSGKRICTMCNHDNTPADVSQPRISASGASLLRLPGFGRVFNQDHLKHRAGRVRNPFLDNRKEPHELGSDCMDWVTRAARTLRAGRGASRAKHKHKVTYEFQPASKVWLAKRISHAQNQAKWQRWEWEDQRVRHVHLNTRDFAVEDQEDVKEDSVIAQHQKKKKKKKKKTRVPYIPPVISGGQVSSLSLQQVFDTPRFRVVLRQFLEESYCQENIDFLEAVEEYIELVEEEQENDADNDDDDELFQRASKMYEQFVKQGAPDQVNIDSKSRQTVGEQLEKWKKCRLAALTLGLGASKEAVAASVMPAKEIRELFDQSFSVIFKMVEKDVFVRFAQTSEYTDMLASFLEDQLAAGKVLKSQGWDNKGTFKSVHIDLLRASNLPPSVDPYVIITVDGKSYESKIKKGTSHPEWGEHFEFPLASTTQYFEANLFDHGVLTADSALGGIYVPIECVPTTGDEIEYLLLARQGQHSRARGTLTLRVSLSTAEAKKDDKHELIEPEKHSSLADVFRSAVSKKKLRYQEDGFDLDLTYITDRIIAMGWPSEGKEAMYRNPMSEVQRFFNTKHPNCYKIYNLCSERVYNPSKFEGRVAHFPFPDHNPPPFRVIPKICSNVIRWLNEHPQNVCGIHCKAGKGRTGCIIASVLLATCELGVDDAEKAIATFAERRTSDKKGVTIPSQLRYIHYAAKFFKVLRQYREEERKFAKGPDRTKGYPVPDINPNLIMPPRMYHLSRVRLHALPKGVESAEVWFEVTCPQLDSFFVSKGKIVTRRITHDLFEYVCGAQIPLFEDAKLEVYHSTRFGGKEMLSRCWFNTRFIRDSHLILAKAELDKARKEKVVGPEYQVEMVFSEIGISVCESSVHPNSKLEDIPTFEEEIAKGLHTAMPRFKRTNSAHAQVSTHLHQRSTRDKPVRVAHNHEEKKLNVLKDAFNQHLQSLDVIRQRAHTRHRPKAQAPRSRPTHVAHNSTSALDNPSERSAPVSSSSFSGSGAHVGGVRVLPNASSLKKPNASPSVPPSSSPSSASSSSSASAAKPAASKKPFGGVGIGMSPSTGLRAGLKKVGAAKLSPMAADPSSSAATSPGKSPKVGSRIAALQARFNKPIQPK